MRQFQSIDEFHSSHKTIVTLGTFDGVHVGHKKILDRLVSDAAQSGYESTLLTFFPHPRMVLQEQSEIRLLNTLSEKAMLLESNGLDNLIIHPFSKEFSRLTALEFVEDILVKKLNIRKIVIGYDHRFGRNRTANIDDLIHFGKMFDFEVEQISAEEVEEVSVSSTKIRNALLEGNILQANQYLGYPYFLTGIIKKGQGLGRTIGFPTANLHIEEEYKLIPKNGVYVIQSYVENQKVYGMMNIGINPTVNGKQQSIEIHFFNIDEDLYRKEFKIELLNYIRPETKFPNIDLLKEQLYKDREYSLSYIASI